MSNSVRKTLSAILILHPVAALLTLIMLILGAASHMHSASHSARYLLGVLIFTFITFLISLASFIIDILLFMPHMAYGTYLVLAATVLLAASVVVLFAMRRTVVGRKARQRRIAENAEMSGENYYTRENQIQPNPIPPPIPMASGANNAGDGLPAFATFENKPKEDTVSDERMPLTSSATDRSPSAHPSEISRSTSRDRYGNPINQPSDAYSMQNGSAYDRNQRGRGGMGGGMGPPRGRGGPRGGYGSRGRGDGPGGYGGRGGYGSSRGRGGYGSQRGGYAAGAMGMAGRGGMGPQSSRGLSEYGDDGYSQPSDRSQHGYANSESHYGSELARAESPPPLPTEPMPHSGAVEMDGGAGGQPAPGYGYGQDARGNNLPPPGRPGYMSDGSKYSTDQYVPPRAAWNQDGGSGSNSPRGQSPVHAPRSPIDQRGPGPQPQQQGQYYDDVAPRFEGAPQQPRSPVHHLHPQYAQYPPQHSDQPYEDVHATVGGARSPAESDHSNFTSISQRGVNPRWNGQGGGQPAMPRPSGAHRAAQQRQDMILDNADFQVPGSSRPRRGPPGSGMVPGSAYPNQMR